MHGNLAKAREAALGLEPEQRAELAEELLDSLEEPMPGVEQAWADEIARRLEEVRRGEVKCIPWSVVEAQLDAIVRGDGD